MKQTILLLIGVLSGITLMAQNKVDSFEEKRPTNNIYITLLGDASIASFNYERLFALSSSFILAGKLGVGYHARSYDNGSTSSIFVLPHHLKFNLGKKYFIAYNWY